MRRKNTEKLLLQFPSAGRPVGNRPKGLGICTASDNLSVFSTPARTEEGRAALSSPVFLHRGTREKLGASLATYSACRKSVRTPQEFMQIDLSFGQVFNAFPQKNEGKK
jgi:hypothetical protein